VVSAIAARAQDDKFFIMGGASSIYNKQSFTELYIPYNSTYAMGGRGIAGIEVPVRNSKMFGLEGSVGFGEDNLKLTDDDTNPVTTKGYGLRNMRASGDLVVRSPITYWGIYPYAVAGVEYDYFSPSGAATSLATTQGFAFEPTAKLGSQSAIGVNVGGGLDWKATAFVDLRLDIRDHLTTSPTFGLPTSQPSTTGLAWFPVSGNAHNIEVSLGIVYHFRGRPAPTPAASPTPSNPSTSSAPSTSEAPSTSSTPSTSTAPAAPAAPSSPPSRPTKQYPSSPPPPF